MNWGDFHGCRWLIGLSAFGFASGLAPAIRAEEPDWFKLNGLPEPMSFIVAVWLNVPLVPVIVNG